MGNGEVVEGVLTVFEIARVFRGRCKVEWYLVVERTSPFFQRALAVHENLVKNGSTSAFFSTVAYVSVQLILLRSHLT